MEPEVLDLCEVPGDDNAAGPHTAVNILQSVFKGGAICEPPLFFGLLLQIFLVVFMLIYYSFTVSEFDAMH